MRVYFAPCGIGLGHAARLIPIAERLRRDGAFISFSTYEDPIRYVKDKGFPVVAAPPIRFQYREDGIFDVRRTFAKGPRNLLNFLGQVAFETTSIESFKPDVVVSDSRLSSLVAARILSIPRVLVINQIRVLIPHLRELTRRRAELKSLSERVGLEVLTTLWHSSQVILVPDFAHPYTISKANLAVSNRGAERVSYIGPLIGQRPEDLPSKEKLLCAFNLSKDRPLIFANYNGTPLEKAVAAQVLDPLLATLSDEFSVVISHGIPNRDGNQSENSNPRVYDWLPQKYEMLRACDIFVSNCGHTSLAEAMYYGVPILLIPTKGHTERTGNAESVARFGSSILLDQARLTATDLRLAARRLAQEDSYHKQAVEIQKQVTTYNATETAISAIRGAILGAAGF